MNIKIKWKKPNENNIYKKHIKKKQKFFKNIYKKKYIKKKQKIIFAIDSS